MSETAHRYYRPSSGAPLSGIMTMLTVGTLAAAVLGAVYGAVSYYNPLIYFTFIAAAIFGAGVGMAIRYGARIGRVRNRNVVWGVSFVIAALAVYLCWVAYVSIFVQHHANAEVKAAIGPVVMDPLVVGSLIQAFAKQGLWEIKGGRPTGWALYSIWTIEALIIGGVALLTAVGECIPFCEACHRWTEPEDLDAKIPLENAVEFAQALEAEQYSKLLEINSGTVNAKDCVHLTVYGCPMCEDSDHLTAVRKIFVTNDKGEEETKEEMLFANMIVPHRVIEGLATLPVETQTDLADDAELASVETEASSTDDDRHEPSAV